MREVLPSEQSRGSLAAPGQTSLITSAVFCSAAECRLLTISASREHRPTSPHGLLRRRAAWGAFQTAASKKTHLSQVLFSFPDLCAWETHLVCPHVCVFPYACFSLCEALTLCDTFLDPSSPPAPSLLRRGRVPDGCLCRPVSEHPGELPLLLRRPRGHEAEPGPQEL